MKKSDIIRSAITGLIALGVTSGAGQALAAAGDNEKCAGIVKAGKNDCGTSKGSCAGTVKADKDAEAWIYVPKGTCDKISGGKVTTSADAKPGGGMKK
ncbi:MAG TPA: DUF2282 domain-containing protein [Burkholderiales bacterium]